MRILSAATEDQMIAAFLRADVHSPRDHGPRYRKFIQTWRIPQDVIDSPDTNHQSENALRRIVLATVRGYPGQGIFLGFPDDIAWHEAVFDRAEIGQLLYVDHQHDSWAPLSHGTRLVSVGAASVIGRTPHQLCRDVRAVAGRVSAGDVFPELICLGTSLDGPFVLLEGHTRATAYAVLGAEAPIEYPVLVGVSPRVRRWHWYGTVQAALARPGAE